MRTRRTFLALAATAAVAGCQGEQGRTPPGTATEAATGTAPTTETPETEPPGSDANIAWRTSVSGTVRYRPAVGGERVFAGTETGTVAALSALDGQSELAVSPDDRITDPLVAASGTVLAVASPDEPNGQETLYAFDGERGDTRWEFPSPSWWLDIVGVDGDTAFVATTDDAIAPSGESLHAVDLADGTERWSAEIGDPSGGLVTDDRVYAPHYGGLSVFAKDGTVAWTYDTQSYGYRTLSVLDDSVALVTADDPRNPTVRGLDAETGTESWTFDDFAGITTAAVGNRLLVGGESVASLDPATGEVRWQVDIAASPYDPPHANGTVYVVGDEAAAISLDDGTVGWRSSVEIVGADGPQEAHLAQPAGLVDGRLLIRRSLSSDDRNRHLLALDTASGERDWSYTADSELTRLTIGESRAYAGEGDSVLAFEP